MKRVFLLVVSVLLFTSCSKKLYNYGMSGTFSRDYSVMTTKAMLSSEAEVLTNAIEQYETLLKKQKKGERQTAPPGFYADYGFILIKQGEIEKGKEMLEKEVELYPESKVYIDQFIKLIEQ